jgi:hypothetical protein
VPENKGMPIYLDETDRSIADSLEELDVDAWFPSNSAAQKLWRCLEAMRDIDELLAESGNQNNATKRKRKLKIAITPLHSLISAIDDLCNDILSNQETNIALSEEQINSVIRVKSEFSELLPHDYKSTISSIRNKLSSHVDNKIHPSEAQKLSESIVPHEFGRWLHICLHLALDLTKFEIYTWSCKSPETNYVCFMHNEPFIVTMQLTDEGARLVALNIAKSSPRNAIPEVIESLIDSSQWMFKKGQPRIHGLKEDRKEHWNTFSENLHIHQSRF